MEQSLPLQTADFCPDALSAVKRQMAIGTAPAGAASRRKPWSVLLSL